MGGMLGFIAVIAVGYFLIKVLHDREGRMFLGIAASVVWAIAGLILGIVALIYLLSR